MVNSSPQQSGKRKIDARAFIADVKAGIPNSVLATRYDLTKTHITTLKANLVKKGLLDEDFRPQQWTCPKCGYDVAEKPAECPKCGLILTVLSVVEKKTAVMVEKTRRKATDALPWLSVGIQYLQIIGIGYLALGIHWGAAAFVGMMLWILGRGILYYDKLELETKGLDASDLETWWLLFTPLYIYRRTRLVNGDYWVLRVDILLTIILWFSILITALWVVDSDFRHFLRFNHLV